MSLNTETLNTILALYIRSLTDGKTAENGVWEAINCFGTNWDIDAVDFPAMFAQATQQARAVMDTPALQPIGGMQALMMRPTEVELVRECFRWLFNDDDGDLKKRQGRVEMFADQVNGRFRRCLPRMAKFTQTAGSAALYLSLLEPEDNYFFVPAEAKAWAAYFGYDEDFGTGAAFSLTQYYAMCDDLLNELPKYDELTRLHTHLARLHVLLDAGKDAGRRLDFTLQECFREINTCGNKIPDVQLTRMVVDFKNELEKRREQVQNLE